MSLCQVWLLVGLETSSSFLLNTCPCDADSQNADSLSCHVLRSPRHKERPHGNNVVSMVHMDHSGPQSLASIVSHGVRYLGPLAH